MLSQPPTDTGLEILKDILITLEEILKQLMIINQKLALKKDSKDNKAT